MTERRIMYICGDCADNDPEGCGHFDRNDLRVMPDGKWLCEACFEDTTPSERGFMPNDDGEFDSRSWHDMPAPTEFVARSFDTSAQWQPIETAPKDGTRVLYFSPTLGEWIGNEPPGHMRGNWNPKLIPAHGWSGNAYGFLNETHWMSRPSPPIALSRPQRETEGS